MTASNRPIQQASAWIIVCLMSAASGCAPHPALTREAGPNETTAEAAQAAPAPSNLAHRNEIAQLERRLNYLQTEREALFQRMQRTQATNRHELQAFYRLHANLRDLDKEIEQVQLRMGRLRSGAP